MQETILDLRNSIFLIQMNFLQQRKYCIVDILDNIFLFLEYFQLEVFYILRFYD